MTRLEKLQEHPYVARCILWEEGYDEPRPGYFASLRRRIETMDEEQLLDLWCRGQNLIGFAHSILYAVDTIRAAIAEGRHE